MKIFWEYLKKKILKSDNQQLTSKSEFRKFPQSANLYPIIFLVRWVTKAIKKCLYLLISYNKGLAPIHLSAFLGKITGQGVLSDVEGTQFLFWTNNDFWSVLVKILRFPTWQMAIKLTLKLSLTNTKSQLVIIAANVQ